MDHSFESSQQLIAETIALRQQVADLQAKLMALTGEVPPPVEASPLESELRFGPTPAAHRQQSVELDLTAQKLAEVEQQRLLATEREQRLLAETLGEIFLTLAAQTHYESALDEIFRQMRRIVPYTTANIMLVEDGMLRMVRWQGYQNYDCVDMVANLQLPLTTFPLIVEMFQSRQPLLINRTTEHPYWTALPCSAWIKSYIGLPICRQDRVLGLLQIDGDVPDKFSTKDVERLQPLAYAAAIVLENTQLYDQLRHELAARQQAETELLHRNAELLTLLFTGATIAASLDLSFILKTFTREMGNLLGGDSCLILVLDQETNLISMAARHSPAGWEEQVSPVLVDPLVQCPIVQQVLVERRVQQLTISQARANGSVPPYLQENGIKTLLLLPMEICGRLIGLVEVTDSRVERVFTYDEIAPAQMLANQTAGAIENTRLYHQARQEIAERIQTEQALRQSQAKNRALLDAIPDVMFRVTHEGQYLDYHCGQEGGAALPTADCVGKYLSETLPADIVELTRLHIHQTLDTGQPQMFEYQLPLSFGVQDYETRLVVSGSDEVLGIVRDITERKRMEAQAIRAERLATLGQLSATLAHEINNPLQAIQSHLDLILDFSLEPGEEKQFLQIIRQEVSHLGTITRRILNFARPQPAVPQLLVVTDLLQEVLALVNKRLQQNKIQVTTAWSEMPLVEAAPDQLSQVFLNLIINGVEAVPANDGQLHITICSQGNRVIISFVNNGPIIPPETQAHIFEPFFTTKPHGNGLGLWVSQLLVQQHGGSLTVENLANNAGVAFIVNLPAALIKESR